MAPDVGVGEGRKEGITSWLPSDWRGGGRSDRISVPSKDKGLTGI